MFMPEWVYSVIAVVVVTLIVIFFVQKRRNEEWEGVLHKKRFVSGDEDSSNSYSLVFKTDDGKKKRYQVSMVVFNEWNEGDRARKVKGEFFPSRV